MSSTARYVRWQDGDMWLGYFEHLPDYLRDLRSGEIPGVRSVAG